MVSKVDEFKTVVLAFDDVDEVANIINALRYAGNDDLACEIEQEVYGECDGCDCGDVGAELTLASLIFDVDTSALEAATVKLNDIAEAAERAANEAERLEVALK